MSGYESAMEFLVLLSYKEDTVFDYNRVDIELRVAMGDNYPYRVAWDTIQGSWQVHKARLLHMEVPTLQTFLQQTKVELILHPAIHSINGFS